MPDIWGLAAILTKFLLYSSVLGASGLVISNVVFAHGLQTVSSAIRQRALFLSVLALGAAALSFSLRGAFLTGDASGMADTEMLALLWESPVGEALEARVAGILLLIAGLMFTGFREGAGNRLALAGVALVLWSFTRIGHVQVHGELVLRGLLFLHLLAAAFWIGILTPLSWLAVKPDSAGRVAAVGHRFGRIAAFIVPGLIIAGVVLLWRLSGSFGALLFTGYGQGLLLKVSLVSALLILATLNKLKFVPALQNGDADALRSLHRSVAIERVAVTMILLATAVLTSVLTLPD